MLQNISCKTDSLKAIWIIHLINQHFLKCWLNLSEAWVISLTKYRSVIYSLYFKGKTKSKKFKNAISKCENIILQLLFYFILKEDPTKPWKQTKKPQQDTSYTNPKFFTDELKDE